MHPIFIQKKNINRSSIKKNEIMDKSNLYDLLFIVILLEIIIVLSLLIFGCAHFYKDIFEFISINGLKEILSTVITKAISFFIQFIDQYQ